MKLWLLKPREALTNENPYDKVAGFVIRARSEKEARNIANDNAGDEKGIWLDTMFSACEPLTNKGEPCVVLCDFYYG